MMTSNKPSLSDSSLHVSSQCTHAKQESVQQKLESIAHTCQQRNLRFTAIRRQVLQIILEAKKPLGAYDILAKLQQAQFPPSSSTSTTSTVQIQEQPSYKKQAQVVPKIIAPPTVYRSLDFLLRHGFIHQLSSTNAFIPCCHPQDKHIAVFLICQQCGKVEELSASRITSMLSPIIEQTKFSIESSVLEVSGRCWNCQAAI